MQEREDSHTESIPESDKLSPEYASKLFFASFRFSQGNIGLQNDIFEYLHAIRPHWKITENDKQDIYQLASPLIRKFVLPTERQSLAINKSQLHLTESVASYHSITKRVDGVITFELETMRGVFNKKSGKDSNVIRSISQWIIESDYLYLLRPNGRERKIPSGMPQTTYSDPFLSHYYYFGVKGNTTRFAEYDQMFKAVATHVKDKKSPEYIDDAKVAYITNKHISMHSKE